MSTSEQNKRKHSWMSIRLLLCFYEVISTFASGNRPKVKHSVTSDFLQNRCIIYRTECNMNRISKWSLACKMKSEVEQNYSSEWYKTQNLGGKDKVLKTSRASGWSTCDFLSYNLDFVLTIQSLHLAILFLSRRPDVFVRILSFCFLTWNKKYKRWSWLSISQNCTRHRNTKCNTFLFWLMLVHHLWSYFHTGFSVLWV